MTVEVFAYNGMQIDVAFILGAFVEVLIHGIYTYLFIVAMPILWKRTAASELRQRWIFPIATILMYILSSLHVALGYYRVMQAYVLPGAPGGTLFFNYNDWGTFANSLVVCLQFRLGDILVIYRCYCIWRQNLIVIIIPLLLLAASTGLNIFVFVWFVNPPKYSRHAEITTINMMYPLSLAQNVITTGLITFKIWNQHRASTIHGAIDRSSRLTLIKVVRIIIESAMIYTGQMFILLVLFLCHNTFQFILQRVIVPSLGIVFVLIALRVHTAKQQAADKETSICFLPSISFSDSETDTKPSQNNRGSTSFMTNVSKVKSGDHDSTSLKQRDVLPTYPPSTH
ncbi:hypothetical protein BDN70DRAFT_858795 [Pholiota conissans]|uniref:Uncharacterized protein n=1 Tax=Pholiota conissans TaxID=109636 RepID=A0A9P6CTB5_9AGAR|nr:hypothetical protein BDN70DRAFT_858795 [Pholiota conissans]